MNYENKVKCARKAIDFEDMIFRFDEGSLGWDEIVIYQSKEDVEPWIDKKELVDVNGIYPFIQDILRETAETTEGDCVDNFRCCLELCVMSNRPLSPAELHAYELELSDLIGDTRGLFEIKASDSILQNVSND